MFDITQRENLSGCSVKELIARLQRLQPNAIVCCCGADTMHLHVEQDGSAICLDVEDLEDYYPPVHQTEPAAERDKRRYSGLLFGKTRAWFAQLEREWKEYCADCRGKIARNWNKDHATHKEFVLAAQLRQAKEDAEYMETGSGAGLKEGDEGYASKSAHPRVPGTDINNVATWVTHLPDQTDPSLAADPNKDPMHQSVSTNEIKWEWVLGGQDAANNPSGKTVFMPTFDKNKDSLKADINGTWEGLPGTGVPYSDYVTYTKGQKVTAQATYDMDDNDVDEPVPVEGTNVRYMEEEHTAKETLTAKVITMEQWLALPENEQKGDFWVYDVDGWAYWANPILPGDATGLLLDAVNMNTVTGMQWYYGINAVAQFITAEDSGIGAGTGFYDESKGAIPTANAEELLRVIGVSQFVNGSVTIHGDSELWVEGATADATEYTYTLAATVEVKGVDEPIQDVTWEIVQCADENVTIEEKTGKLTVPLTTTANTVTVKATSTEYAGLEATRTITLMKEGKSVTIYPDGVLAVGPGGSVNLAAQVSSLKMGTLDIDQNVTWTVEAGDSTTLDAGTTLSKTTSTGKDDMVKLSVSASQGKGTLIVTATSDKYYNDGTEVSSGSNALVSVTKEIIIDQFNYTVTIPASSGVYAGESQQLTASVTATTSGGSGDTGGFVPSQTVTWSIEGVTTSGGGTGTLADGTAIDPDTGVLTVGITQGVGDVITVKATSAHQNENAGTFEDATGTQTITVLDPAYTMTVRAEGSRTEVAQGATLGFLAEVKTTNADLPLPTDLTYTWSVKGLTSDGSEEELTGNTSTISSEGVLSVTNREAHDKLRIYATCARINKSAYTDVNVRDLQYAINLTANSDYVWQNKTQPIQGTVLVGGTALDASAYGSGLTWSFTTSTQSGKKAATTLTKSDATTANIAAAIDEKSGSMLYLTASWTAPDGTEVTSDTFAFRVAETKYKVEVIGPNTLKQNASTTGYSATVREGQVNPATNTVDNWVNAASQTVKWTLTGNNSTKTTIDATTGKVTIGVDESADTISVTASAKEKYSTATDATKETAIEDLTYTVTLTRMVESGYNGDGSTWYSTYWPNSGSSAEIFTQADKDGNITYASYGGTATSYPVTSTDSVLLQVSVTCEDSTVDCKTATVTMAGSGVTFSAGTVNEASGVTKLIPTTGKGMTRVNMNGASGTVKITGSTTFNNGKSVCQGIDLVVSQPNTVINQLVADNKHTTMGGVVNIDGVDFYILKKGAVTDSSSTSHANAALLLTKDQISEQTYGSDNRYNTSTAKTAVNNWVNGKTTLSAKAVPVTIKSKQEYNVTTLDTDTNQKAFLLSTADVFGVNGSSSGWHTQTNACGDTVRVYNVGGSNLVADELTPGVTKMGELYSLIPNGRALRNGAQWWWLRSPRNTASSVAHVHWTAYTGHLTHVGYDWSVSGRYGGLRPALWYDLAS